MSDREDLIEAMAKGFGLESEWQQMHEMTKTLRRGDAEIKILAAEAAGFKFSRRASTPPAPQKESEG